MNLSCYSLIKIGGRTNVEDAIAPAAWKKGMLPLYIVCDGVGGSNFGEVASNLAVKVFYEHFSTHFQAIPSRFAELVEEARILFQRQLATYLDNHPQADNTSTTLTLAALAGDKLHLAWCGDSRIYLLRNGEKVFQSRDHSLVNEMVAQGVITAEEAINHPKRNVITRSLNMQTRAGDVEVAIISRQQPGDWLLLCTDGLLEQFTEQRFPALLSSYDGGQDYAAKINQLCEGKTKDNYSMQLVHLGKPASSKSMWAVAAGLLVVLLGAAILFWMNRQAMASAETPVAGKDTGSLFISIPASPTVGDSSASPQANDSLVASSPQAKAATIVAPPAASPAKQKAVQKDSLKKP